MKVKITRPIRVNCLSGEVEVTQQEYERLQRMGAIETEARQTPEDNIIVETREIPEETKDVKEKKTRKGKK